MYNKCRDQLVKIVVVNKFTKEFGLNLIWYFLQILVDQDMLRMAFNSSLINSIFVT